MRIKNLIEDNGSMDMAVDCIDREMSQGDISAIEFQELLDGGIAVVFTLKDGRTENASKTYRSLGSAIHGISMEICGR